MTDTMNTDIELERNLARTLGAVPKPRLSPGFTAAVLESAERSDRRRRMFRRASVIQAVYGAAVLAATGFIIAGIRWPGWISGVLLALTPFVFFGLASSRLLRPRSDRLLGPNNS